MKSAASAICAVLTLAIPAFASGSTSTEAGTWTATASMSVPRGSLTATTLENGRVLVVGGGEVRTELYDPPTGTWIPGGTLSQPRGLHVAVRLLDGRVLVAGGGFYFSSAEL